MCFHENAICTKNSIGKGTCNGDSGGPLTTEINGEYQLIGISSWGIGCRNGYPDIYMNVFVYLQWIQNEISIF